MATDGGLWRRIYDSPLHNPGLFWLAGALFFAVLALRVGKLHGFLLLFGLEILADCTLTGGLSPLSPSSAAATPVAVAFVLLGDFRYFALMEGRGHDFRRPPLLRAAALTLAVPLVAFALRALLPPLASPRPFFLLYETLFFALASAHGARSLRRSPPASLRFARSLLAFELAQYALWALADVLLLSGVEAGYALRLLPNLMYYALFLPFVLWLAPRPPESP